jgi:branched-chain amino acid transport system ATP-binding protein
MNKILTVNNLTKIFGGISALVNVTFDVKEHELLSIIGPNGAGKTTILNCINGFYRPTQGTITFEGEDITRLRSFQIAKKRVGRTFQNIALFKRMTVLDNIKLGAEAHINYGLLSSAFYYGKVRRMEVDLRQEIEEKIIDLLEIESIRFKTVGILPYGLQKRVELGRALAMKPKLLLLDEPTAGMNIEETQDMARYILDVIEETGISIILVEHDMSIVMDISDRIVVLDFGQIIANGPPHQIRNDPKVIQAYLGEER